MQVGIQLRAGPKKLPLRFLQKCESITNEGWELTKARELQTLKEAMKEAARSLEKEGARKEERQGGNEDREIGYMIAFTRAI